MKKLIFVVLCLFAISTYAQNVSGYFSETTKGNSVKWGQFGYAVGTTVARGETDSTTAIYSRPLGQTVANGEVRNLFMGKKVLLGINITTAFLNVAATLITQISYDGTNWTTLETLSANTTPNVTGVYLYLANFTSVAAPYARLVFNSGALKIGNLGRVQFIYCLPLNQLIGGFCPL